ncbi:ABC transporter ATP-binding protein [Mycolicibacterium goodii]|uniref:ABC-type quaternary amine transporter n=1 Tax=Mycolicibacterium goodii TaxID=134601 RepID=A0A0K0X9P3_MYCGD|nr:sugar ABC transporter [Mycolicibacterium goodii]
MTDANGAAPAGISVQRIHKSYGDRRVLAGVDLDVGAGTITAVLGPSGCGKTTLLRIMAGFDDPDTGVVRIGGHTVVGDGPVVPAHRRRVGLMPQEGALFPHLSVGGNVAFGLASRNGVATEVAHWLEVVGLPGLADARPHELSGGQQQRVALARALAARPRVLLLDEPFAALDAGLRVRVREDIAEILRAAGTTAVLVTHDQSEALSLADSVALLFDGTVAQHAAPADLYDRPANLQTARFIGATVELAGTCHDGVARTALGAHPVRIPVSDGPAVVVLRPEQLRADHGGTPGSDRDAVVRACRFYGADTVLHVVLRDGTALRLRSTGDARVDAGAVVSVEVDGPVLAYPSPPGG